ncbi:hypothetical protein EB810_15350 [Altererythrobacter sp. FM1]|nr:hypothetical protein EB810_15350 [Altererythrobacter sp. FM1]
MRLGWQLATHVGSIRHGAQTSAFDTACRSAGGSRVRGLGDVLLLGYGNEDAKLLNRHRRRV